MSTEPEPDRVQSGSLTRIRYKLECSVAPPSALVLLLMLQEFRQRSKLNIREVLKSRHHGTGCVGRRVVEVTDQPFVSPPASFFHREIRADLSTLAVKLMAHEATFLAVKDLPIRDQVTLRLYGGRALGTEPWQVVDEGYELPGVSLRKRRLPGGHACQAHAILNDPEELSVVPVLDVRRGHLCEVQLRVRLISIPKNRRSVSLSPAAITLSLGVESLQVVSKLSETCKR